MLLRLFLSLCFVSAEAQFCKVDWKPMANLTITRNCTVAPGPQVAFAFLAVGVILCAGVHFWYIVACSRIFCCDSRGCTKSNVAALFAGVSALFLATLVPMEIVLADVDLNRNDHGDTDYGSGHLFWYNVLITSAGSSIAPAVALFYTSISDMACPGRADCCTKKGCCRCWTYVLYWCLAVLNVAMIVGHPTVKPAVIQNIIYQAAGPVLFVLIAVPSDILVCMVHMKMHKLVRKHSTSDTKPPLIVKMDELCGAICRYFYPIQIVFIIGLILWGFGRQVPYKDCYTAYRACWVVLDAFYLAFGVVLGAFACLLEGKRVPTFFLCLYQRCLRRQGQQAQQTGVLHRQLSGLHFTSELGKSLLLLQRHALDKQRQKDFPMEVAMESLLSPLPLKVASAPDMELLVCINCFADNCVAKKGAVPVGQMLRAVDQHVVEAYDIPCLRRTVEKCLKWARDPDRPTIADSLSVDEAAAIQLYTQQTCLYPRLNAALRDHTHPERLTPFLPYLKLLLRGLNKLPLVRERVYRGVRLDLHEQYDQLQGQVFTWWAFSSTTTDLAVMSTPVYLGDEGPRTLFSIDAVGVDVAAFSAFPEEKEVLLLPGTVLTLTSGVNVEPDYWRFEASTYPSVQQQHYRQEESKPQFQNTDLAHPGWEVYKTNAAVESSRTAYAAEASHLSSQLLNYSQSTALLSHHN